MPNIKPIILDGSTLEGGGQLTRVALSLSAICNIPITIHSIRANRGSQSSRHKDPHSHSDRGRRHQAPSKSRHEEKKLTSKADGGLKESHLAALQWLAHQCDAYVDGAEVGSREITFIPGIGKQNQKPSKNTKNNLVDMETNTITLQNPGSIWLIFQALYPFIIFANPNHPYPTKPTQTTSDNPNSETAIELTLHGGTNVSKSMSTEYIQQVFIPTCQLLGLPKTTIQVLNRGWANNTPEIGTVKILIQHPLTSISFLPLPAFTLPSPSGPITKIAITILANPASTATYIHQTLLRTIKTHFPYNPTLQTDLIQSEDTNDPRRLYILLVAHTSANTVLGRDFLGSGRTPKNESELHRILDNACETVTRDLKSEVRRGGALDEFMQDQIVVFQALAKGRSVVHGGVWEKNVDGKGDGNGNEDEEVGDQSGSLHARTVRWVCDRMLTGKSTGRGVVFEPGGVCEGVGWGGERETGDLEKKMEGIGLGNDG